ncbi:helix-turn-helix domain-containing protein [Lacticaseibacillus brantae]|nr:helix-turn-helix transcriptional regulator [Lacticaseibacillus brantae]
MIQPVKEKMTLRQWRLIKDVSVKELAIESGVTEKTIYNYEHNISMLRNAKYSTIANIADVLGIAVSDIFLSTTSEKPKF